LGRLEARIAGWEELWVSSDSADLTISAGFKDVHCSRCLIATVQGFYHIYCPSVSTAALPVIHQSGFHFVGY